MAEMSIKQAMIALTLLASLGGLTYNEIQNHPYLEQTGGATALFGVLEQLPGMNFTYAQDENYIYLNATSSTWNLCFDQPAWEQTVYIAGPTVWQAYIKTTIGALNVTPVLYRKSNRGFTAYLNLYMIGKGPDHVPAYRDHEVVGFDIQVPGRGNTWRDIKPGDCLTKNEVNRYRIPTQLNKRGYIVSSTRYDSTCYKLVKECAYGPCIPGPGESVVSTRENPEEFFC